MRTQQQEFHLNERESYLQFVKDAIGAKICLDTINLPRKGYSKLIFTRTPELYKGVGTSLLYESNLYWMTELENQKKYLSFRPKNIENILEEVENKIESYGKRLVFIDGLEYLETYNGFDKIYNFISKLSDVVKNSKRAILLVPFNPKAFEETNANKIKRLGSVL